MRQFLVFEKGRCGHSVLWIVRADTVRSAICRWLTDRDSDLVFEPDGRVWFDYEGATISYPHPLACIEAMEKSQGEWTIGEVPAWVLDGELEELLVGEHPLEVEENVRACREAFPEDRGIANASAFVWYLRDGVLVTFYRKNREKKPFQIRVLKRCYLRWRPVTTVTEWEGDYDELLERLWLMPEWWARKNEAVESREDGRSVE